MMKKLFSVIMFALIASVAHAHVIDGTWQTKIAGPDGDMELTFVFKVTDGKLTGVVRSPNGDMEISNTKLDGKQFSFDVSFNGMTIKHDCTLQDDNTVNMKVTGTPMGDSSLVLKKQA